MRSDYHAWLVSQKYGSGTVTAQLHRTGRVEKYYGDLDEHFARDQLASVIADLRYSTDDERRGRPNPSKVPFEGNVRNNLASYRFAVEHYRKFREAGESVALDEGGATSAFAAPQSVSDSSPGEEGVGQRIGLERDMQAALRLAIDQLETGLVIIDDGVERSVDSGFIDITARDASGAIVVIELKAAVAGQRAVAQILSYMGDIAAEESGSTVRGLLIASDFDRRARSAAKMAPALALRRYSVRFQFSTPED